MRGDSRIRRATWKSSPATNDWNTDTNWNITSGTGYPNGLSDVATFATSSITAVSLSANTVANSILFNSGASAFTITATPASTLGIGGNGITNNSGITQNFVTAVSNSNDNVGIIAFENSATAGSMTVFTNNGSALNSILGGVTGFANTSTADNGTFINNGGTVSGALGGLTKFNDTSTAGSATLIANGGLNGGVGGTSYFLSASTGGMARVEVFGNGKLDISFHIAPGVTIGSIEGNGFVFLGANNLTVGSNKRSTTFSGTIQDGGDHGGTGGSLSKIGKGKLTLNFASSYTGGTTLNKGTLLLKNTIGSATGSGPMQVNTGTLEGVGIISGAVTVGNGSSSGAILLAGNSATKPGTLTINNTLTFNSLSTYKCVLNRSTSKASKVSTLGVTINSNVPFTFLDTGTGTPAPGSVFTIINNTSANPISGRFSNLANGATFTSNGTTFKASYTGGTGNDLTLTVQ